MILIKLPCNFIEITLRHECSPVELLQIFRTSILRTPLDSCFWIFEYEFRRATSKTWTWTLENLDVEKPGPWITKTLKNLDPEKHGINMALKIMSEFRVYVFKRPCTMWFAIKFTDNHNYIFHAKNCSYNNYKLEVRKTSKVVYVFQIFWILKNKICVSTLQI